MPNRLQHESSPYLLQHAENPVDWFPWGEEAFNKAKAEDKPPVPELLGKAKNSSRPANPARSGTSGPHHKMSHAERPISKAYPVIGNDLARNNVENDLSAADVQDLSCAQATASKHSP